MIQNNTLKKFVILGSCVSRDIFDFAENKYLQVILYLARTKVVSQMSPSLNVKEGEVALLSAFQKRLVLNDLNKLSIKAVIETNADYCLIDYIDERFPLCKIDNTYITKSNELVNSGWLKNKNYQEIQYIYEGGGSVSIDGKTLDQYLGPFLESLINLFPRNKFIIHEAYMIDIYYDEFGELKTFNTSIIKNNYKINAILSYLYICTENYIKDCNILSICKNYSADKNHKWGLSPMHYEKGYYLEAVKFLENLSE